MTFYDRCCNGLSSFGLATLDQPWIRAAGWVGKQYNAMTFRDALPDINQASQLSANSAHLMRDIDPRQQSKNREIEILRAVAVILTIMTHARFVVDIHGAIASLVYRNFEFGGGVDIFFCVSGFVITSVLCNGQRGVSPDSVRLTSRALRDFWVKRIYRLLPAAWLWAIVVIGLSFLFNRSGAFGFPKYNFDGFIAVVSYTHNFWVGGTIVTAGLAAAFPLGIYWSLSLVEQFYFLYPILMKILSSRAIIAAAIAGIVVEFPIRRAWPGLLDFVRLDGLMWGIVIFHFSRSHLAKTFRPTFLQNRAVAMGIGALLILLVAAVPVVLNPLPIATGVMEVPCALLVLLASYDSGYIGTGIKHLDDGLVWLGSRSYSLYLTHCIAFMAVQEIAFRLDGTGKALQFAGVSAKLPIALVLMLILADGSYRWLERPLRMRGRRIVSELG